MTIIKNESIYRVFTGNCGKVMGTNTVVLSSYIVIIILFVLPNVGHLREMYPQ